MPYRRGQRPDRHLDAVLAQGFGQRVAQWRGLAGQQVLARLDQGHLGAETVDGLGQLGARRAPAEHHEAPRDLLHACHVVGAPHTVELAQPGDRRHHRI